MAVYSCIVEVVRDSFDSVSDAAESEDSREVIRSRCSFDSIAGRAVPEDAYQSVAFDAVARTVGPKYTRSRDAVGRCVHAPTSTGVLCIEPGTICIRAHALQAVAV